jgi:hypothetical protein
MTPEKVQRLREIGFRFPEVESTVPVEMEVSYPKEKRTIYKRWYENRDKLKEYMDAHDGSADIPKDDEEHAKLRGWLDSQHNEYKKYMDKKDSSMTQEKLKLLQDIGFEFTYTSFEQRLEQLKAYKEEHGNVNVPMTHPELGKWFQSIRRQCKIFVETGESTRDINAVRFAQLKAVGVNPSKRLNAMSECNVG